MWCKCYLLPYPNGRHKNMKDVLSYCRKFQSRRWWQSLLWSYVKCCIMFFKMWEFICRSITSRRGWKISLSQQLVSASSYQKRCGQYQWSIAELRTKIFVEFNEFCDRVDWYICAYMCIYEYIVPLTMFHILVLHNTITWNLTFECCQDIRWVWAVWWWRAEPV